MQINFKFQQNDPIIQAHLTGTEIGEVETWQESDGYDFEWHPGHPTGYPLYIRPYGCTVGQNLPKFDTKNHTAGDYTNITDLPNGQLLRRDLDNNDQNEILALIAGEWDKLATLARRMWEGERVGDGKSVLELWGEEEYAKDSGQHDEQISRDQLRRILGLKW